MKTFLVFTDFSKNAERASEYAVQLASRQGARLQLIHVFEEPVRVSGAEVGIVHYHNMENRILEQLEERKEELKEQYGTKVEITCMVFNQFLIDRIQDLFSRPEVKLAIIGLTGSGMSNLFFGKNTLDIVQQSKRTILTIPPHAKFKPVKRILFAYNTNDISPSDISLDRIKRILSVFSAELFILRVNPSDEFSSEAKINETILHDLFSDIPHSLHLVNKNNIVAGIKDFAKEIHADLMAIIPKERDFWEQILHGNHTKKMLFRSDIPIISIPQEEP